MPYICPSPSSAPSICVLLAPSLRSWHAQFRRLALTVCCANKTVSIRTGASSGSRCTNSTCDFYYRVCRYYRTDHPHLISSHSGNTGSLRHYQTPVTPLLPLPTSTIAINSNYCITAVLKSLAQSYSISISNNVTHSTARSVSDTYHGIVSCRDRPQAGPHIGCPLALCPDTLCPCSPLSRAFPSM